MIHAPHEDEHRHASARGGSTIPRRAMNLVLTSASLLCAACLLAWLGGRVFTDRWMWSQWLWFAPTALALGVACIGGVLAAIRPARNKSQRSRRVLAWLAVLAAIGCSFALFEHRLLTPDPALAASEGGVRLAHWNLRHPRRDELPAYAEALRTIDADVLILTSAAGALWQEGARDGIGRDLRPYSIGVFTILSRLPIRGSRQLAGTETFWASLIELDAAATLGRSLIIYLVDLPSDPSISRMEAAKELRAIIDQSGAPAPDIVVGDFNTPRRSASIDVLFPGMTHAFDHAGHGYVATFSNAYPLWHIDHVLLAPPLRAADYDVVDMAVGTHRMQAATIVR